MDSKADVEEDEEEDKVDGDSNGTNKFFMGSNSIENKREILKATGRAE